VDPEYAQRYRELYERHWWWRAREQFVLETVRRHLPTGGRGAILDVGCGDGLLFDRLAEFGEVQGVESDPSLVGPASPHRDRIHVGPFDASFAPGKRYGLILMLDVIEHLPDPAGALRRAVDLLEPDGLLVVTVPAFRLLWTTHDDLNHHYTRYTRHRFAVLARAAGVRVIRAAYFFHWLFPAKLVTRLIEGVARPRPSSPRVPPRWVNETLYGLSRLEQRLLGRLGVPFGSSLLVVGRRLASTDPMGHLN
jgi:2-polyprenyl-3-methyl-5-hydroxy-6-metoxy-1,4-benzoquinol methylase